MTRAKYERLERIASKHLGLFLKAQQMRAWSEHPGVQAALKEEMAEHLTIRRLAKKELKNERQL